MEEWDKKTVVISTAWLVVWIGFGIFALYLHNLLLPYIYFVLAIAVYITHAYFACTRCFYYGKMCYILGGLISPRLFKARRQGPLDPDDAVVGTIWMILGAFPLPFLIYYQDWLLTFVYLSLTVGWFYYRKRIVCVKCKNAWCGFKPK